MTFFLAPGVASRSLRYRVTTCCPVYDTGCDTRCGDTSFRHVFSTNPIHPVWLSVVSNHVWYTQYSVASFGLVPDFVRSIQSCIAMFRDLFGANRYPRTMIHRYSSFPELSDRAGAMFHCFVSFSAYVRYARYAVPSSFGPICYPRCITTLFYGLFVPPGMES
jgi:hypothetical protein